MTASKHIALFGGSFDPPHVGHVLAACYAKVNYAIDEIWVLPVARHAYGKELTAWEIRFQLCQLAFAPFSFVQVRDDELSNIDGYTFDLLAQLRAQYPDHAWWLLGGTDTAEDLPNWYRGQELMTQIKVLPIPRGGYDDGHPAALPTISSSLVRERMHQGQDISDLVPLAVRTAIHDNGWYRS